MNSKPRLLYYDSLIKCQFKPSFKCYAMTSFKIIKSISWWRLKKSYAKGLFGTLTCIKEMMDRSCCAEAIIYFCLSQAWTSNNSFTVIISCTNISVKLVVNFILVTQCGIFFKLKVLVTSPFAARIYKPTVSIEIMFVRVQRKVYYWAG